MWSIYLQLDDAMRAPAQGLVLVLTRKLLRLCTDKEKEELEEQAPTSWTEELVTGMWMVLMATGRCPSPAISGQHLAFSSPASAQHTNSRASELYARENRGVVLAEALKLREADPCLTLTQWLIFRGLGNLL